MLFTSYSAFSRTGRGANPEGEVIEETTAGPPATEVSPPATDTPPQGGEGGGSTLPAAEMAPTGSKLHTPPLKLPRVGAPPPAAPREKAAPITTGNTQSDGGPVAHKYHQGEHAIPQITTNAITEHHRNCDLKLKEAQTLHNQGYRDFKDMEDTVSTNAKTSTGEVNTTISKIEDQILPEIDHARWVYESVIKNCSDVKELAESASKGQANNDKNGSAIRDQLQKYKDRKAH